MEGKGWTGAGELKDGDKLTLITGQTVSVQSIVVEQCTEPVKVYNFEVEDFHTYYVGHESVLVHNKCSGTELTFEEALAKLEKSGLKPGQTVISKSRVMQIMKNYSSSKAQSSIYINSTGRYLVDGHHTTVASVMLGKGTGPNMNVVTRQLPSATNIHWTKKWYEVWKTAIKVVD